MSQLCKSVQYSYWSKNMLRLNMHQKRSILKDDKKFSHSIAVRVLQSMSNLVISLCCDALVAVADAIC